MIIPIFVIGLVSSILTEILKVFPKLKEKKETERIVAFIVSFLIAGGYLLSEGQTLGASSFWVFLGLTISATFVIYKSVVQTIKGLFVPVDGDNVV